jgi:hypothetical protein
MSAPQFHPMGGENFYMLRALPSGKLKRFYYVRVRCHYCGKPTMRDRSKHRRFPGSRPECRECIYNRVRGANSHWRTGK